MRTHCIAQGTVLHCSAVTSMGRKSKKEQMYVCTELTHFAVQQKLTQHFKATTLQLKF